MAAFNNNKNQPEIINLLDSDDEDGKVTTTLQCRHIPTRVLENGHVEIIDSDDEEEDEENRKRAARNVVVGDDDDDDDGAKKPAARPSPPKRQRIETNFSAPTAVAAAATLLDNRQQDLQIVQQKSTSNNNLAYLQNPRFVPAAARSATNDDEELELLGSTGQNALSEFPHSRENCVNYIFASTRHEQHCTHCVRNHSCVIVRGNKNPNTTDAATFQTFSQFLLDFPRFCPFTVLHGVRCTRFRV